MTNYAFGILPTIIRQDSRVSDFACRLYSEVDSLSNKFGYCFATNSALGKTLGKAPGTISRTLAELESFNYVNLVIEDGFKRKIYPKRDFREFEGVDEFEQGDNQKRLGVYSELSRGVIKNGMTANKNKLIRKQNKNNVEEPQKENSILATVHDQVDETAVKVIEVIPSKTNPISKEEFSERSKAIFEVLEHEKKSKKPRQPKYIYPPTQDELVPLFYAKLQDKKRQHPQIIDCWNWANMEAEKFFLHWERKNWQIQKLGNAIATWVNGSITFGTVTKSCPIQYKGNPANAQPAQPTKVHVETKSPEQSKEARKAMFAAAKAELNQIGV